MPSLREKTRQASRQATTHRAGALYDRRTRVCQARPPSHATSPVCGISSTAWHFRPEGTSREPGAGRCSGGNGRARAAGAASCSRSVGCSGESTHLSPAGSPLAHATPSLSPTEPKRRHSRLRALTSLHHPCQHDTPRTRHRTARNPANARRHLHLRSSCTHRLCRVSSRCSRSWTAAHMPSRRRRRPSVKPDTSHDRPRA